MQDSQQKEGAIKQMENCVVSQNAIQGEEIECIISEDRTLDLFRHYIWFPFLLTLLNV